jgi:hypothetical protein
MTPVVCYYLSLWNKYKIAVENTKKFLREQKQKELTVTDTVSVSEEARKRQDEHKTS